MKFMNLVQFKTTQVMFKTRNTMFPSNIQNLFKNREGRYGVSRKCNLKQPCAANALKNMCISVCGVTLSNSPDKDIKESKNIAQFKINISNTYFMCIKMKEIRYSHYELCYCIEWEYHYIGDMKKYLSVGSKMYLYTCMHIYAFVYVYLYTVTILIKKLSTSLSG